MVTTTKPTLPDIRKRLEAATPGPWTIEPAEYETDGLCYQAAQIPEILTVEIENAWYPNEDDVAFIAHARTDIPHLLSLLERCEKFLEETWQISEFYPEINARRAELKQLLTEIKGNK